MDCGLGFRVWRFLDKCFTSSDWRNPLVGFQACGLEIQGFMRKEDASRFTEKL